MTRFAKFMADRAAEVYSEPLTEMHTELTRGAMGAIIELAKLTNGSCVLDVGCGQGPALRMFKEKGIRATGIALNVEDVSACLNAGLNAWVMDQNDIKCADSVYDLVWARHVLEHSVAPLWTLTEFFRVLKPGGWLYAEMPAPDTCCVHECNLNHYSVLGERAWVCLMQRAGFGPDVLGWRREVGTPLGMDIYFSFATQKPCKKS